MVERRRDLFEEEGFSSRLRSNGYKTIFKMNRINQKLSENKKLLSINLEDQTITNEDNNSISFDIEPFRKKCLLEGIDDIALTLKKCEKIKSFETSLHQSLPWIV